MSQLKKCLYLKEMRHKVYEGFDVSAFLLGLPLGMLVTGIVGYFVIRKGKKERRYDERYTKIHNGARSIGWFVSFFFIIGSWAFVIMYEKPSLAFFVLTAVYIVHVTAYGIGAAILNKKH